MLPRIYLIRHGETEWSLSGRHTGHTDIPLTAQGEASARELGPRLAPLTFARVLTSPRRRARQTCELAGMGSAAETEPDLAEWDYGEFEGRRSVDILTAQPTWNIFHDGCPGGETTTQISARADRLVARLRTMNGNIALFSHGHFGRVLGARWIGLPISAGQHLLLSTASISVLGYEHDRSATPAIVCWNSTPAEFLTRPDRLAATASGHARP